MINRVWTIYRDNKSTFYDYRTNRKHSRLLDRLIIAISTSIGMLILPILSKDVLNSVITVQAILIGFSFSVMFFLVQNHKNERGAQEIRPSDRSEAEVSLEEQLRQDRLRLLSKELFWNISYFNMIAFASLVFALFLMVPNIWDRFNDLVYNIHSSAPDLSIISSTTYLIAKWMFLFFLIESSHTFLRTVGRVNFLFEQRMGHGT